MLPSLTDELVGHLSDTCEYRNTRSVGALVDVVRKGMSLSCTTICAVRSQPRRGESSYTPQQMTPELDFPRDSTTDGRQNQPGWVIRETHSCPPSIGRLVFVQYVIRLEEA